MYAKKREMKNNYERATSHCQQNLIMFIIYS